MHTPRKHVSRRSRTQVPPCFVKNEQVASEEPRHGTHTHSLSHSPTHSVSRSVKYAVPVSSAGVEMKFACEMRTVLYDAMPAELPSAGAAITAELTSTTLGGHLLRPCDAVPSRLWLSLRDTLSARQR